MSIIGSSIAQSIAGLSPAEKVQAREKRPEKSGSTQKPARRDEQDQVTVGAETADAVRNLKGNDQEEAREDRQEHPGYTGQGDAAHGEPRPQLDLEG